MRLIPMGHDTGQAVSHKSETYPSTMHEAMPLGAPIRRESRRIVGRIRRRYGIGYGPSAIYLLCFASTPLKHAAHYLGYVGHRDALGERIARHRSGDGARLVKHLREAGGDVTLALRFTLPLSIARSIERRLKQRNGLGRMCPFCIAKHRAVRTVQRRDQRARRAAVSTVHQEPHP